ADPPAVEGLHGDLDTLARLAQQIGAGHPAVLEVQLDRVRAADAQLLLLRANLVAGRAGLNDKARYALVFQLPVRLRPHQGHLRHPTVGYEYLGAVEHVGGFAVALLTRRGSHRRGVRAGHRLGERVTPQYLAPRERLQVFPLLLLVAEIIYRPADERVLHGHRDRR